MEHLFVYGTLQPGGPNAHVLTALEGTWQPGVVRGRLVAAGWGATQGYPGLVLNNSNDDPDLDGEEDVGGYVLASNQLADLWAMLDAFEGKGYRRVRTTVSLAGGGEVSAYVYVLQSPP